MILVSLKNSGDVYSSLGKMFAGAASQKAKQLSPLLVHNNSVRLKMCLTFLGLLLTAATASAQQTNLNYPLAGQASTYPSLYFYSNIFDNLTFSPDED